MMNKLLVTTNDISSKKGFDVLNLHNYPYNDGKFNFLQWAGFEKCKIEIENRRLYDLVIYSEVESDFNYHKSLSDYYIYTDRYQSVNSIQVDDYPQRLICPSYKFWFCNSITFNIISHFNQRLYNKTNNLELYLNKSVSEEDAKFWNFLSMMIIRTDGI